MAACLVLAACGFSPIYGPHGGGGASVAGSMNDIALGNIPDRQGQMLRNRLIDRMYGQGRPDAPDKTLAVTIRSSEVDLGIQKDATASRRELNLWADYVLSKKDGTRLAAGTAHSVVGFSKLDAQYGTVAAEDNARERAVGEVAEQIVNRISLYLAEKADKKDLPPPPAAKVAPSSSNKIQLKIGPSGEDVPDEAVEDAPSEKASW